MALVELVCGGTVLNFPRLSFDPTIVTGIAVLNPNDELASMTLTPYGEDGKRLLDPVSITIESGRQFADVTASLFGTGLDPDTIAWFQGISSSDNLTGFFLFLDLPDVGIFDGADLPQLSKRIIFNEVRIDSDFSTELNLINPGPVEAAVELLLAGSGTSQLRSVTLPSQGILRLDTEKFFQENPQTATSDDDARYVTASSNIEIGGFSVVRGTGDLLGSNARPASETLNTLFFPQMAVLHPFRTLLALINYSDEMALVTVTAFQQDGALFGSEDLANNPVTLGLESGQIARLDLEELFGFFGSKTLDGWIRVDSTAEAVNGSLSYRLVTNNSTAAVSAVAAGTNQAVFSHLATALDFFTGVAILNGGTLAANVRVLAVAADGTVLGTFTTVLQPGQRISKLIQELIPEAADQAGGFIWVRSDVPVFLTSLFGNTSGVLANIPTQPVPTDFRPDRESPTLRVSPPLAVLAPGTQQQFLLDGTMVDPVWSVNGNEGGNSITGTISAAGVLSAPASAPSPLPVTVTAQAANQTASASVDVLSRQLLVSDSGVVQSVAYLAGLKQLYTSELAGSVAPLETSSRHGSQPEVDSAIFNVSSIPRQKIADFMAEDIPKMVPFAAGDGREYLLLAGNTSGRIIRLDPESGQITDVVTGLESPTAIAINPVTRELLIAEATQIRIVSALELNRGLLAPATVEAAKPIRQGLILGGVSASGIAADQCSGNIYLSDRTTGQILVIERGVGASRPVVAGLDLPVQILGLQRHGTSCSQSFHLFVVERGPGRISLVTPFDGSLVPWLQSPGGNDLAFLPPENPLSGNRAVLLGEVLGNTGQVVAVDVPGLYQESAQNPGQAVQAPASSEGSLAPGVYYFPLVAYGQGPLSENDTFHTSLTFHNEGDTVVSVAIDFLDAAGEGLPLDFGSGPQTSLEIELQQGGVSTSRTTGSVTPEKLGYARMTVAAGAVSSQTIFQSIDPNSTTVSIISVPALTEATRFFSLEVPTEVEYLALIVINPDPATNATITARLFDRTLLAGTVQLAASPLSWSLNEIAGPGPDFFGDVPDFTSPIATLTLESSQPVFFSFLMCDEVNSCQLVS